MKDLLHAVQEVDRGDQLLVLGRVRRDVGRRAAALLGVADVRFLHFTDGELVAGRALLGAIVREIREFQPYAVYTHDPEPVIINNAFVNHSDHRATGLATVDAVYPAARDRLNFPEHIEQGLRPHKVRELYLWGANEANFDVDISDLLDLKIRALLAHLDGECTPEERARLDAHLAGDAHAAETAALLERTFDDLLSRFL